MAGGWSSREKVISVSDPRRYSVMVGCEEAARNTCLVTCFCCLLEGLPSWIMYILPWASGYCSFSSGILCRSWIAATSLVGRGGLGVRSGQWARLLCWQVVGLLLLRLGFFP